MHDKWDGVNPDFNSMVVDQLKHIKLIIDEEIDHYFDEVFYRDEFDEEEESEAYRDMNEKLDQFSEEMALYFRKLMKDHTAIEVYEKFKEHFYITSPGVTGDLFEFEVTPEQLLKFQRNCDENDLEFLPGWLWINRMEEQMIMGSLKERFFEFEKSLEDLVDYDHINPYLDDLAQGWNYASRKERGQRRGSNW